MRGGGRSPTHAPTHSLIPTHDCSSSHEVCSNVEVSTLGMTIRPGPGPPALQVSLEPSELHAPCTARLCFHHLTRADRGGRARWPALQTKGPHPGCPRWGLSHS